MKLLRAERLLFAGCSLALATMVPWFASCADTENEDAPKEDSSASVPPGTKTDAGTLTDASAMPETSCDASDPTCSSAVIPCDKADFCPVATPVSTLYSLTAVWGSGPNDVWAVGSGGTIVHWDGTKWTATPTSLKNTFHAVWGSGPNDVWAVSMTDVLLHTNGFAGGTATWTKAPAALAEPNDSFPRATLAIWGTSAGDVRIGARDRTVFDPKTGGFPTFNQYTKTTRDGGVAWEPSEGVGAVNGIWGSSKDDVWVISDNSEKNGWQRGITRHGTTQADPDGGPATMTWVDVDSQASVTLEGIWGSGKDDVWVVGDMGVIRRMTKGATRWAIVTSPTNEALHAIWGSAANDVWAVGDYGTILHFDGTAWKPAVAALPTGKKKPHLFGVWGSGKDDVWIVGDGIALHHTAQNKGTGNP